MRLWVWISAGFVVLWSVVIVVQLAATGTVGMVYPVLWAVSVVLLFLDNRRTRKVRSPFGPGQGRVVIRSDKI